MCQLQQTNSEDVKLLKGLEIGSELKKNEHPVSAQFIV